MSQTFTLVNPDREEYAHLGEYTAMEHLTSAEAMAKIGYLVLASSMDGSTFSGRADPNDDNDDLQDEMEHIRQREIERELENLTPEDWEKYYERARENATYDGQPIDEVDEDLQDDIEADIKQRVSEQVAKWARSAFRDRDTFKWDEHTLATSAAASLAIGALHEYAGRWGGDRVALVGNYAEDDSEAGKWEDATREHTIVELPSGETKRLTGTRELVNEDGSKAHSTPIAADEIPYADEQGDLVLLDEYKYDDLDEDTVATVVEVEPPQFDDITDGLNAEFEEFVGENWLENQNQTVLNPDTMLSN